MLQVCGVSFIFGFSFASNAVFLNLTLLHTPNKYADCFSPPFVSSWACKNRGMLEYRPIPLPIGFPTWHNTRWLEPQTGLPFLPVTVMTCYVLPLSENWLFSGVGFFFFLVLACKGNSWKRHFFPMSGGIISILHNLSPFSVSHTGIPWWHIIKPLSMTGTYSLTNFTFSFLPLLTTEAISVHKSLIKSLQDQNTCCQRKYCQD